MFAGSLAWNPRTALTPGIQDLGPSLSQPLPPARQVSVRIVREGGGSRFHLQNLGKIKKYCIVVLQQSDCHDLYDKEDDKEGLQDYKLQTNFAWSATLRDTR